MGLQKLGEVLALETQMGLHRGSGLDKPKLPTQCPNLRPLAVLPSYICPPLHPIHSPAPGESTSETFPR